MAFIVTPSIIALGPGSSAVVQLFCPSAPGPSACTFEVNAPGLVISPPEVVVPGPVNVTISAEQWALGTYLVSFTVANDPNDSGTFLPVAIIPPCGLTPGGRTSAAAIATVRRRTNMVFGEPDDSDICAMLNDGLEQVAKLTEPILATKSLPIINPNTNLLAFPADVDRIRDANFSTGNPALGGTVVYEMVQLEYNEFIQETDSTPAGGIGGIPTIYSLVADQSGVQLIQFYPYASTGYINIHYYKRPIQWYIPQAGQPASYTDMDSGWQEAAILFACQQACENREDLTTGAKYFAELYKAKCEEMLTTVRRRRRKNGTVTVRDVSINESVTPIWMR
jgi:hypothetical protein